MKIVKKLFRTHKDKFIYCLLVFVIGCEPYSELVIGPVGSAGQHTPVPRDSQGNIFGYYEYLPLEYDSTNKQSLPLIFYWNGATAITGNGRSDLSGLLNQGLPMNINKGHVYPAIIISAQLKKWQSVDVHPFVEYILIRYHDLIDRDRIYMTGFSAGGGITVRYAQAHPENLAAIVPIAPAVAVPGKKGAPLAMSRVPSWFFHNYNDEIVETFRSEDWHKALVDKGGDHKLTIFPKEGHYAWEEAYQSQTMWEWLYQKRRSQQSHQKSTQ